MTRIVRLQLIESTKPGEPPDIAEDGTILNPEPYHACDVTFDDGIIVQVERPSTENKVREAYRAAKKEVTVDELTTGQNIEA